MNAIAYRNDGNLKQHTETQPACNSITLDLGGASAPPLETPDSSARNRAWALKMQNLEAIRAEIAPQLESLRLSYEMFEPQIEPTDLSYVPRPDL